MHSESESRRRLRLSITTMLTPGHRKRCPKLRSPNALLQFRKKSAVGCDDATSQKGLTLLMAAQSDLVLVVCVFKRNALEAHATLCHS